MNIKEPCSFFPLLFDQCITQCIHQEQLGFRFAPRDIGVGPLCIVDHLLERSRWSWRKFGEAMGTGKGYEEVMGFNGFSEQPWEYEYS